MKASIDARRKALAGMEKPKLEDYLLHCDRKTLNLVASFQRALMSDLVTKTLAAARASNAATLFVTGGVAANNELRQRFEQDAAMEGLPVYFPSRPLIDRQRSHDRSRGVSQISGQGFCWHGFFGGSRDGVGWNSNWRLALGNCQLSVPELSVLSRLLMPIANC